MAKNKKTPPAPPADRIIKEGETPVSPESAKVEGTKATVIVEALVEIEALVSTEPGMEIGGRLVEAEVEVAEPTINDVAVFLQDSTVSLVVTEDGIYIDGNLCNNPTKVFNALHAYGENFYSKK